jgi:ATP-binding cassette subfamily B protein
MRDLIRGITGVLQSSWRASPARLIVSATLMLIGAVSWPLLALFLGVATDAALSGDAGTAVTAIVAVALTALLSLTMEHFAHIFFFELADLHTIRVERELGELVQGTVGLEQHERQDYSDRMELLRKETNSIGAGVQTVLTAITLLAQIILTAVLLARVEPWLLVLPLFALPPLIAGRVADSWTERAELATAEQSRLSWHLLELGTSPVAAKEVRLFGLQPIIRQRLSALLRDIDHELRRTELTGMILRIGSQVLYAAGYVGAVVLVVRSAISGERSVGDVVLIITLAVQTNAQAAGVVSVWKGLQLNARALAWLRWLRMTNDEMAPTIAAELPAPTAIRAGIDLVDVTFRYPGTDRDVLTDATIHIPAGSTVAIVGENGAGKSTMVKLLCRFYEPTGGRITVDGTDLREIDPVQWRARLAAGFQDFIRLNASAHESIGVGDLPHCDDLEAVGAAVTRADADVVISRLPQGLDSQLGRAYADGEELSGGQWQRIALSRAMMRPEPLLLVLDEPTAALDPLTEHALFERYADAAREAAVRTGGITILVSHRFSTVRMADLILVVSDGRIEEAGSHQELMEHEGIYAELFTLQAAAYR